MCAVVEVCNWSGQPRACTQQWGSASAVYAGVLHSCSHRGLNWLPVWFLGSGKGRGSLRHLVSYTHTATKAWASSWGQSWAPARVEVEAAEGLRYLTFTNMNETCRESMVAVLSALCPQSRSLWTLTAPSACLLTAPAFLPYFQLSLYIPALLVWAG